MITAGQPSVGDAPAVNADTGNGKIGSTGSDNTGAIAGGGTNHVVRTYSGAGKIRMQSSDGSNHVVRMYCP